MCLGDSKQWCDLLHVTPFWTCLMNCVPIVQLCGLHTHTHTHTRLWDHSAIQHALMHTVCCVSGLSNSHLGFVLMLFYGDWGQILADLIWRETRLLFSGGLSAVWANTTHNSHAHSRLTSQADNNLIYSTIFHWVICSLFVIKLYNHPSIMQLV